MHSKQWCLYHTPWNKINFHTFETKVKGDSLQLPKHVLLETIHPLCTDKGTGENFDLEIYWELTGMHNNRGSNEAHGQSSHPQKHIAACIIKITGISLPLVLILQCYKLILSCLLVSLNCTVTSPACLCSLYSHVDHPLCSYTTCLFVLIVHCHITLFVLIVHYKDTLI